MSIDNGLMLAPANPDATHPFARRTVNPTAWIQFIFGKSVRRALLISMGVVVASISSGCFSLHVSHEDPAPAPAVIVVPNDHPNP